MGRKNEGLAEERKAQELDPISENTDLTRTPPAFYLAHDFDQAIAEAKQALDMFPESGGMDYWIGQCYEHKSMPEEAIAFYLKAYAHEPEEFALRRAAYQKHGLPGYWEQDAELRKKSKLQIDPILQAMYYAHTGEKDKAIQQLELAYQQHCDGLQFLKVEPVYDGLRDDPRFRQLIAKLGL